LKPANKNGIQDRCRSAILNDILVFIEALASLFTTPD